MYYIKPESSYWRVEQRLSNGNVTYTILPTPSYFQRQSGGKIVLVSGLVMRFEMRRTDIVVPQGQTVDSFLSALLNPSPIVTPGGGGSGGYVSENEVEVNTGTYFVLPTDKNIICTGNCTIVLPSTTLGKFEFTIFIEDGIEVSLKAASGETVNNQTDIILFGIESVTVKNLLVSTNWSIK